MIFSIILVLPQLSINYFDINVGTNFRKKKSVRRELAIPRTTVWRVFTTLVPRKSSNLSTISYHSDRTGSIAVVLMTLRFVLGQTYNLSFFLSLGLHKKRCSVTYLAFQKIRIEKSHYRRHRLDYSGHIICFNKFTRNLIIVQVWAVQVTPLLAFYDDIVPLNIFQHFK